MTAIATLVGLKAMETAITAIQGMMVIGRLTGKLTDMQRLLQVLTNTAYMEAKTQSMITKREAV